MYKFLKIIICTYFFLLAGCVSCEEFYEEAVLSRKSAYAQWKAQKENKAKSQTSIQGKLTIEDCMKLTLLNNKQLQQVLEEREIARGQKLQSYSAILPRVDLNGQYQRLDELNSIALNGQRVFLGSLDNYSTSLTVTQPIFEGGAIPARLNAGTLGVLMSEQTVRDTLQDVIYSAAHAYYDLLLAQQLVQISADAVRASSLHLENVSARQKAGTASDFDVLRAQVELSNFNAEHIQNKNAINIAKTELLRNMGVSQQSEITLADELEYKPESIPFDSAVSAAFRNRPDLMGREFDIKFQKEILRIAKSQYWPVVNAFYNNIWSKPDPRDPTVIHWHEAWDAGVAATIPLFDGFSREGQIISQKARLRQSQIDLIDTEERALFELTKFTLSVANAAEFVESQRLNLIRAQESLRLSEVGYKEGTQTQVEVIDAQAALTQARVYYFQAIYSHIIAKLDLERAMGILAGGEIKN